MFHTHYLWFQTRQRQEILDITDEVAEQVGKSGVKEGMVLVSAMHISASVFVNDHESGLWHDILHWLENTVAPWDPVRTPCNSARLAILRMWLIPPACTTVVRM